MSKCAASPRNRFSRIFPVLLVISTQPITLAAWAPRQSGTDLSLRDVGRLRSCLFLCFFDFIVCHQHSDPMLDRYRRRKTEFASEPKRIHLELLCSSGLMNLS